MITPFAYLKRFDGNPIIEPKRQHSWESRQTFNPGAVLLEGKIHILYRAIGDDGISRFGYAVSENGYKVDDRPNEPVYEQAVSSPGFNVYSYSSGGSFGGAEDPRIVHVTGEDVVYLTYTACDAGLRMALTSIKIEDIVNKRWNWAKPTLISPPGQVHKNWVIFPEKFNGKYAILHSLNPQIMVSYHESLSLESSYYLNSYDSGPTTRHGDAWDTIVRGAGAPPIKTELGWLLFYHAMTLDDYGKYKVGAMLLDLNDPGSIIYRSTGPVLKPSAVYENSGFKPGIIYLSGAVVKGRELLLYYGASDSYVCVASCELDKILDNLVEGNKG
jgi:beta-1,2-mannobiose phosphorylase / 1,2-beta-oligomannan phosphorylase